MGDIQYIAIVGFLCAAAIVSPDLNERSLLDVHPWG